MEIFKTIFRAYHRIKLKRLNVIIESKARFNSGSKFEGYNFIHAGACVSNSSIGKATYVGPNSFLANCVIGKYCCISSDVQVVAGSHPSKGYVSVHPAFYSTANQCGLTYSDKNTFDEHNYINSNVHVIIGNDVWIGTGTKIMGGVTINNGAIIGMGSVVTKDVDAYSIVGGVPAKVIKYRFSQEQIKALEQFKWWDKSDEWLKENISLFQDVDLLMEFINSK